MPYKIIWQKFAETCQRGGTVVEHSPGHSKVEGSSPRGTGTGRGNGENRFVETGLSLSAGG